ncbi:hypothetical protein QH494_26090 [Sphingomonas sp. AR_OL41]|uniref:hypothetical protein n=1 Tax=Sphingomonas sp. AR_OL41 TaxID=3042729 RepID=UPI00248131D3|nr:hypothetical protein [Sphingomonas sp. AR_OL41]MDH7975671.1 hypothetical protein [Sphingomonas sp. AR_OL41]
MIAIPLTLLMAGCESYLPSQPRFNSTILLPKGHQITGGVQGAEEVRTPTVYHSSINTPVPTSCTAAESSNATRADRDDCIRDLETDIDAAFGEYQIQLQADIGKTNSVLNIGGMALSTAGTAVTGTSAKTVLAALGTGVGSIRSSISEDYLYKSTMQSLHSQMIADRAKVATRIENAMKADFANYNMHSAYRDLIDYYYAGTLLSALQSINADAGAKAAQCTAAAAGAKATTEGAKAQPTASVGSASATNTTAGCDAVTYTYNYGDSGAALSKIWRPDGKIFDKSAEAKLKACMAKLGIAGELTTLINGLPDEDKNKVLGCYKAT